MRTYQLAGEAVPPSSRQCPAFPTQLVSPPATPCRWTTPTDLSEHSSDPRFTPPLFAFGALWLCSLGTCVPWRHLPHITSVTG